MDCSPPGFSVRGILQARIVEWVAISFSRGFSPPRDGTRISRIDRWILYHWVTTLHMAITAWGTGGSTHGHDQLPSCYTLAKWLPHSHRVGCEKFKDIYSLVPQSYHDNWIKWNSKRYSINPKEGMKRTSRVVQWLRICLATQGTRLRYLFRELRFHRLRSN